MKKVIMVLVVVMTLTGAVSAQDTVRYPDPCYMYQPFEVDSVNGNTCGPYNSQLPRAYYEYNWLTPLPGFVEMVDSLTGLHYWLRPGPKSRDANYSEYVAEGQTMIYGIATTTFDAGRKLDSIYSLGERYNISYINDTNFNLYAYLLRKDKGRVYCVDSVKWIRHKNPYRYFEYRQYPRPGCESLTQPTVLTYSYEFYFDQPIAVVDTFYIGVRFPYGDSLACLYMDWDVICICNPILSIYRQTLSDGYVPLEDMDFCNDHGSFCEGSWGRGFFPILTPRDTTRCEAVRDVRMAEATDSSVTLEWDGGNASQWEVEYAEAQGMTTSTVTTAVPTVMLTGLRPTTTYLAHVRGMCSWDSVYGDWSGFVEARTTAHQPDTQPGTGSADAVGPRIRIMPNPAVGMVEVTSSYSMVGIALYDVRGHVVREQEVGGSAATIDVGDLPKGVYVVTVRTVAGTATQRLVVE